MGMLCVPRPLAARRLLPVVLFIVGVAGCGADVPTQPTSSLGPHKAIYLIYLTDAAEVALRHAEYPSGVAGLSPEEAARTFHSPLSGEAPPEPGFVPPGILIPEQGYPFDHTKRHGTVDPSGMPYHWVGYFYCLRPGSVPCPPN